VTPHTLKTSAGWFSGHFALPTEARDVVADVAVRAGDVARGKMAGAADINLVGHRVRRDNFGGGIHCMKYTASPVLAGRYGVENSCDVGWATRRARLSDEVHFCYNEPQPDSFGTEGTNGSEED